MRTFGSLFSGGGGWDVGAMAAGLSPTFSVEMHRPTAEVMIRNLGHAYPDHLTYIGSILDADPRRFPSVDVIASSPPCQAHSAARQRPGLCDREDGGVGLATILFVEVLRPTYVVLENVPLYVHHASYKQIVSALKSMGYVHDHHVVDASRYGVPSSRKRLVARFGRGKLRPFPQPGPHQPWLPAVVDLVSDFPVSKLAKWQTSRIDRMLERHARLFYPLLISSNNVSSSAFNAGKTVKVARNADEPAFTIVSTAKAMTGTRVLHEDGYVQALTPRAFARLQSFPDWYQLPSDATLAIRVVGNAVPPRLSEVVLRSL